MTDAPPMRLLKPFEFPLKEVKPLHIGNNRRLSHLVRCVEDYAKWVHLVAAMLRGGFTPEEAGKIAGGNYLRIFRAAVG